MADFRLSQSAESKTSMVIICYILPAFYRVSKMPNHHKDNDMRYRVLAVAVAAVSLLGCGPANLANNKTHSPFEDSPIYSETLANGLQLYVIERQEAGLAMELLVDVGAKDELEGQAGVAHFVEHMMFQGTQRYPRSALTASYQEVGLALGPDVNAFTGTDDTLYKINLPGRVMDTQAPQNLMRWLADVINGEALISEQEVASERGVILAERAGRQQESRDFSIEEQRHWLATTVDYRDALGDKAVIQRVSAAQLKQFYQQHYRADNATLFVSSDQPEQWLEAVRAEFSKANDSAPVKDQAVVASPSDKQFPREVPNTDLLWQSDKMRPFTRLYLEILDKPRVTQSDWQAWHFADLTQELLQLR